MTSGPCDGQVKLDYDFTQAVEEAIANGMDPNQARQDKHIRWNTDCATQPDQGWVSFWQCSFL
jgi:hypothetical protein